MFVKRVETWSEIHIQSSLGAKEIASIISDDGKSAYQFSPCFGLDTSHLRNFWYCETRGFGYRYIIWNRHPEKDRKKLISDKLQPVGSFNLVELNVTPECFNGFNFTVGKKGKHDSGSWTDGVRFQRMIPLDAFSEIRIASD